MGGISRDQKVITADNGKLCPSSSPRFVREMTGVETEPIHSLLASTETDLVRRLQRRLEHEATESVLI